MGRLHRCDYACRCKTRDIRRIGDLEMLYPPAPVRTEVLASCS